MRILVISNLGLIRQTVEQALHGEGHAIQTAETVPLAVELLKKQVNMDVIICEWSIRDSTAFDLYQQYRQIDRLSDQGEAPFPHFLVFETPGRLMARTTVPVKRDIRAESLIALGHAEFVDKPIDRTFLRERIRQIETVRGAGPQKSPSLAKSKVMPEEKEVAEQAGVAVGLENRERVEDLEKHLRQIDEQLSTTWNQLNGLRELIAEVLQRGGESTCLVSPDGPQSTER